MTLVENSVMFVIPTINVPPVPIQDPGKEKGINVNVPTDSSP